MRKLLIIAFMLNCLTLNYYAQTSKFTIVLKTSLGVPITTGVVEIILTANTYPTGALTLTHEHDGVWSRLAVPDGEYSLYFNGSISPTFQKFYIGESRLTKIANQFKGNYKLLNSAIDSVNNISLSTDTLTTRSWIRAQKFGGTIADSLLIIPNPYQFTYTGDTLSIRDTLLNQYVKKVTPQTIANITGNSITVNSNLVFMNTDAGATVNTISCSTDGLSFTLINLSSYNVTLSSGANLLLAGSSAVLSTNSAITFVYKQSVDKCFEISRSIK